jgi:phospholipase/lecithinase/hemolysin
MPAYGMTPIESRRVQWNADSTLFTFFIGINDILNTYGMNNATLVPLIFAQYRALVDDVYNSGARNFLFLDVPPLQNSPLSQTTPDRISIETIALKDWATRLGELVDHMRFQYKDVMAQTFSTYGVFEKIFKDARSFKQTQGLKQLSGFCNGCKIPAEEYFWKDSVHPMYTVHDALAAEIGDTLKNIPALRKCDDLSVT